MSLTDELLEALESWLQIHSPFEVYLRSLLRLYGLPENKKLGRLPELAGYQIPIVSRLLQTIRDRGGCMLVASTGLGKTVMASHLAGYLRMDDDIDSILLFCPAGLREMWDKILGATRIRYKEYSYHVLSADDWKQNRKLRELEYEISQCDNRTLMIIDESHHLRNEEESRNVIRKRNARIMEVTRRQAKVLLMTATPYSRGVGDINAQLNILPQGKSEGLFSENGRWQVEKPSELSEIPVSVVLTAPSVVRHFSEKEENGERYVLFSGNQKRYFPAKMRIHSVRYENQLDQLLFHLLQSGLLNIRPSDSGNYEELLFAGNDALGNRDALLEARIISQFCSSIAEVETVLGKMSREGGFEKTRFARQDKLTAEILQLKQEKHSLFASGNDAKWIALTEIIRKHPGKKILIFCVYRETALYLKNLLCASAYSCETTVNVKPDDLEYILKRFSPVANEVRPEDPDYDEIMASQTDILVATGSMAEGFNLQDAPVLVNYDLPWTVLVLAQRMGRILRPWHSPREIDIYNLIPSTMEKPELYLAVRWNERLKNKSTEMKSFADLPVLGHDSGSLEVEMLSLAKALLDFSETEMELADVIQFLENTDDLKTSSFLDDLSKISKELSRELLKIPPGFHSTRNSSLNGVYVLFHYQKSWYPVIFSNDGNIIEESEAADKIMKLIQCRENEETVITSPQGIVERERLLESVKISWASSREINPVDVIIDCYMILQK